MELESAMKQEINRCREWKNKIIRTDPRTKQTEIILELKPGDAGYLPPVEEFVTIRFHNGIIVMPAEEFKKLSKAKQKKLMKW